MNGWWRRTTWAGPRSAGRRRAIGPGLAVWSAGGADSTQETPRRLRAARATEGERCSRETALIRDMLFVAHGRWRRIGKGHDQRSRAQIQGREARQRLLLAGG